MGVMDEVLGIGGGKFTWKGYLLSVPINWIMINSNFNLAESIPIKLFTMLSAIVFYVCVIERIIRDDKIGTDCFFKKVLD